MKKYTFNVKYQSDERGVYYETHSVKAENFGEAIEKLIEIIPKGYIKYTCAHVAF